MKGISLKRITVCRAPTQNRVGAFHHSETNPKPFGVSPCPYPCLISFHVPLGQTVCTILESLWYTKLIPFSWPLPGDLLCRYPHIPLFLIPFSILFKCQWSREPSGIILSRLVPSSPCFQHRSQHDSVDSHNNSVRNFYSVCLVLFPPLEPQCLEGRYLFILLTSVFSAPGAEFSTSYVLNNLY